MFELYVVQATGGTAIKGSGVLVAGGDVDRFKWAPDSSRILYLADQDLDNQTGLYSTLPTSANSVLRLSGLIIPPTGGVSSFEIP